MKRIRWNKPEDLTGKVKKLNKLKRAKIVLPTIIWIPSANEEFFSSSSLSVLGVYTTVCGFIYFFPRGEMNSTKKKGVI